MLVWGWIHSVFHWVMDLWQIFADMFKVLLHTAWVKTIVTHARQTVSNRRKVKCKTRPTAETVPQMLFYVVNVLHKCVKRAALGVYRPKAVTRIYFRGCWRHRRWKGSVVGGHHGECGARAYNGGLRAEPPAGVRGQSRWKHFGHWMSNGAGKFSTSLWKQYVLLRSTGVSWGAQSL